MFGEFDESLSWYLDANIAAYSLDPKRRQTVVANHMRTDVLSLVTMEMVTADMVPDNPGTWLFHCHVAGHLLGGLQATFTVE